MTSYPSSVNTVNCMYAANVSYGVKGMVNLITWVLMVSDTISFFTLHPIDSTHTSVLANWINGAISMVILVMDLFYSSGTSRISYYIV
jgi:hypothetical protein